MTLLLLLACAPDPGGKPAPIDTSEDGSDSATDSAGDTDTGELPDTDTAPPDSDGGDADGDGWTTEAGDCDDADPHAFPGAPERCDGWDQDCDGAALAEDSCAGGIDVGAYGELPGWVGPNLYAYSMVWGTSTGGPSEELVVSSCAYYEDRDETLYYVAFAVFRDLPTEARQSWPAGAASVIKFPDMASAGSPDLPLRDHDGDGLRELIFPTASYTELPSVLVIDEPGADVVEGEAAELARAWWAAPERDWDFGEDVESGGDLDGDGLADTLIVSSGQDDDGTWLPSTVYLAYGGARLEGEQDPTRDVVLHGESDGSGPSMTWAEWVSRVYALPDLDGDGAQEWMVDAGSGGSALGSGAALADADGAALADVLTAVTVPPGQTYKGAAFSPGDWDGDGVGDLAWGAPGDTDGDDCIYIASYRPPFGDDVVEDTLQTLCKPNAHVERYMHGQDDLDGDGRIDPIFFWSGVGPDDYSTTYHLNVVVPSTWLDGGRADVADVGIRVENDSIDFAEALHFADLDDDGLPELLSSIGDDGTLGYESPGLIEVLQGFPIPFDDPAAWAAR